MFMSLRERLTLHVKFISVLGRLQNKSLLMDNIVLAISCVSAFFMFWLKTAALSRF